MAKTREFSGRAPPGLPLRRGRADADPARGTAGAARARTPPDLTTAAVAPSWARNRQPEMRPPVAVRRQAPPPARPRLPTPRPPRTPGAPRLQRRDPIWRGGRATLPGAKKQMKPRPGSRSASQSQGHSAKKRKSK